MWDITNINRTVNIWSSSTPGPNPSRSVTVAQSVVAQAPRAQHQGPLRHHAGSIEADLREALSARSAERLSLGEMLEEHASLHAQFCAPASRAERRAPDSVAGIVQMHLRSLERKIDDELRALEEAQQREPGGSAAPDLLDAAAAPRDCDAPTAINDIHELDAGTLSATRLQQRLELSHAQKGLSGEGENCAWRAAWPMVLLQMQPAALERAIVAQLGDDYLPQAAHLAEVCAVVQQRDGCRALFTREDGYAFMPDNSRLQLPGLSAEEGEDLLQELSCALLVKGGLSDADAVDLVYGEGRASAHELLCIPRQLGAAGAVLELPRDATGEIGEDANLVYFCAQAGDVVPDTESAESPEQRADALHARLRDVPVALIQGEHFALLLPNHGVPQPLPDEPFAD
ncbi:hypothetical protein RCH09_001773 [Actimicrobium sp. GrIS 1.19]|uniref:hypothetical protein n=1 Tax=Actimicrobium sp. GrIS 1.19 TaxID=3071708 RepID=UPI002E08211E|nr:hypothetical protein [Actimicrobium sp. GrIS 1.19]